MNEEKEGEIKISEIAAVETLFPIFRSDQTVYRLKVEISSYTYSEYRTWRHIVGWICVSVIFRIYSEKSDSLLAT